MDNTENNQYLFCYHQKLFRGVLLRRYQRFLADIRLQNNEIVTAHCTNSGSMLSCLQEGAPVFVSPVADPLRKTRFTWEMIMINGQWVGINTHIPNKLVAEMLRRNLLPGLEDFAEIRPEVKYNESRLDFFASKPGVACFIEVKNVTLKDGDVARFPDSVTLRGQKHLFTLMELKEKGIRAVMIYVIQRMDLDSFAPAAAIDKAYAVLFAKAMKKGVEMIPVQVEVSPEGIKFSKVLPVVI
jgi:sugar fermentation stimulation protein A